MALGEVIGVLILAGAIIAGLKNAARAQHKNERLSLK